MKHKLNAHAVNVGTRSIYCRSDFIPLGLDELTRTVILMHKANGDLYWLHAQVLNQISAPVDEPGEFDQLEPIEEPGR